jgi:hypothetical protein
VNANEKGYKSTRTSAFDSALTVQLLCSSKFTVHSQSVLLSFAVAVCSLEWKAREGDDTLGIHGVKYSNGYSEAACRAKRDLGQSLFPNYDRVWLQRNLLSIEYIVRRGDSIRPRTITSDPPSCVRYSTQYT